MHIEVRTFAGLNPKHLNNNILEIEDNSTPNQVMQKIEVDPNEVKLIFVNNVHASSDTVLKNDDRLALFPPIGGG